MALLDSLDDDSALALNSLRLDLLASKETPKTFTSGLSGTWRDQKFFLCSFLAKKKICI